MFYNRLLAIENLKLVLERKWLGHVANEVEVKSRVADVVVLVALVGLVHKRWRNAAAFHCFVT